MEQATVVGGRLSTSLSHLFKIKIFSEALKARVTQEGHRYFTHSQNLLELERIKNLYLILRNGTKSMFYNLLHLLKLKTL